jgi:hypothetical protein
MATQILMAVRGCPTKGPWKIPTKAMFADDMLHMFAVDDSATAAAEVLGKTSFMPEENWGGLAGFRKMLRTVFGLKTITKKGRLFFFTISSDYIATPEDALAYDKCEFACYFNDYAVARDAVEPHRKGQHTKYLKIAEPIMAEAKRVRDDKNCTPRVKSDALIKLKAKLDPIRKKHYKNQVMLRAKGLAALDDCEHAVRI